MGNESPMLSLGIETSTRCGSVALLDETGSLVSLSHQEPNAHQERLLGMVDQLLAQLGRRSSDIGRVGVGKGPGSFTGLRAGLALAEGIGLGLGIPVLGVGSLRALALQLPASCLGARAALVDARRNEWFLAVYAPTGEAIQPPCAVATEHLTEFLAGFLASRNLVSPVHLAGCWPAQVEVPAGLELHAYPNASLPSAGGVLRALALGMTDGSAEADYVREADAIRPKLPPCPLGDAAPTTSG